MRTAPTLSPPTHTASYSCAALLSLVLVLMFAPGGALAQNGPGGVGTDGGGAGQPDNTVWLRAGDLSFSDGDAVTVDWTDAYGSGTTAQFNENGSGITYQANVVGGQPVLRFSTGDNFSLGGIADGTSTILIVSADDGDRTAGGEDLLTSSDEDRSITYYYEDNKSGLLAQLVSRAGNNKNKDIVSTSAVSITNFSIIAANEDDGLDETDLYVSGVNRGQAFTSSDGFATGTLADNMTGDIAEVIVFDDRLNAAQIEIVANYLSQKYDIQIDASSSAYRDLYGYDTFGFDVAGVGSTANGIGLAAAGDHTSATSDRLQMTASGLANGDFVLFGNDGAVTSFISGTPVNGSNDAQRLRRLWRTDLTGVQTQTVDLTFDTAGLSQGAFNDFSLLVDSDGDFSTGADVYPLDATGQASGVTISNGDYITVARVNRTISFATNLRTTPEDTSGTPVLNVSTNFIRSSPITFDVEVQPHPSRPAATDGTDYTTSAATPTTITIPAGQSTVDLNASSTVFDILNDGDVEDNTEFVEITLTNLTGANAGAFTALDYGIIDDDISAEVTATASGATTLAEGGGGTFTVDVTSPVAGVDVIYELSGTATSGSDYDETPSGTRNTLSFGAAGTQQVTFDVLDDAVFETDETIVLRLLAVDNTSGSGATLSPTDRSVTLTITEGDTRPEVSFQGDGTSVPTFTGKEGTRLDLPVELNDAAGVDIEVSFTVSTAGGASAGDISVASTSPIVVPAGASTANISVNLSQDGIEEVNEDFSVTLTGATNATVTSDPDASATGIILDDDRIGPNGPGGVGDSENLLLWLDAGTLSSGSVASWEDRSDNGNDAVGQTNPTYTAGFSNGQPGVSFDGSSQWMRIDGLTSIPNGGNTLFTALEIGSPGSVLFEQVSGDGKNASTERSIFFSGGATTFARARNGGGSTPGNSIPGVPRIISSVFDGSIDIDVSGTEIQSATASTGQPVQFASLGVGLRDDGSDNKSVDLEPDPGTYFPGTVGELIAYEAPLNSVQRTIVGNYLAAKYGTSLGTSTVYAVDYAGDQSGNGDFDLDVFGVGFESSTNFHVSSRSGGLRFDNIDGLEAGDYLLAGHRLPDSQNSIVGGSSNTTGVTLDAQVAREWYIDLTDSGTQTGVDVSFDLSDMGLGTTGNDDIGAESGYVLISRPQGGTQWDDIATAVDVAGDEITFSNVNLTDGSVITLATTNQILSPLNPVTLIITGEVGNEGDATAGTEGGDAGYRMIGPPLVPGSSGSFTGADLESDTDPQLIEFNLPFPMFYYYDDGTDAYTVAGPSDPFVNGRGALLYLLDDEGIADADPIDPTIAITPTAAELAPATDITVGDGSPTGDAVLNTSATYHFLANPFPYAFDAEALTAPSGAFVDDGASGSFQSVIQAYDPLTSGYQTFTVGDGTEDLLPVWQAFIVERSTANSGNDDQVTFPATGRIFGSEASIIGSKSATTTRAPRIGLQLLAVDGTGSVLARDQAALIQFHPNATRGWDAYDATKLTPYAREYVTLAPVGTDRDGERAPKAVESRPLPSEPVIVDLDVNTVGVDGTFEIEVSEWHDVPEAWTVTLIETKGTADASDDVERELTRGGSLSAAKSGAARVTVSPDVMTAPPNKSADARHPRLESLKETFARYRPTAKSASDSTVVPPYRLRITPKNAPLPVELGTFSGRQAEDAIVLEWTTHSETRNDGFEVQVKPEGASSFRAAGYVSGRGTTTEASSYTFTVEDDLDYGEHTFRLRQVDTDGTASYSKSIPVKKTLDRAYDLSKTAPNPVKTTAGMDLTVREKQTVRVTLYDVLGRRVATVYDSEVLPNQTKDLSVDASRLASGVYFIRVVGENFSDVRRMTVVR